MWKIPRHYWWIFITCTYLIYQNIKFHIIAFIHCNIFIFLRVYFVFILYQKKERKKYKKMNEWKAIRKNVKKRNVAIWNWTIKYRINILLLNFPSQQIKLCTNWLPFEINTIEHHNKQQYPIDTKHDFPPHSPLIFEL